MFFTVPQVLAYLSVGVAAYSLIPYVVDIFRGGTKPSRIGYGITAITMTVTAILHISAGATTSAYLTVWFAFSAIVIFTLSIKYGVGGKTKLDLICLCIAVCAISFWLIFDTNYALVVGLLTDICFYVITINKLHKIPLSENFQSWLLTILAGLLSFTSGILTDGLHLLPLLPPILTTFGATLIILVAVHQKHKTTIAS